MEEDLEEDLEGLLKRLEILLKGLIPLRTLIPGIPDFEPLLKVIHSLYQNHEELSLETMLDNLEIIIKDFGSILTTEFHSLDRLQKVIRLLRGGFKENLSGKDFMRLIISGDFLTKELQDDLKGIIESPKDCYDGEGESIDDNAFGLSSTILLILYLLNKLPNFFMTSPMQTIDFKFDDFTILVDGSQDLLVVYEDETPSSIEPLEKLLKKQIDLILIPLERQFAGMVIPIFVHLLPFTHQKNHSLTTMVH
jgi:hypothetical protein